jgi:hypothetical protein
MDHFNLLIIVKHIGDGRLYVTRKAAKGRSYLCGRYPYMIVPFECIYHELDMLRTSVLVF